MMTATKLKRAEMVGRKFVNPVPTGVGEPGMMWKILPLYWRNREEKVPKQRLGPFMTDSRVYETAPASGLRVTWMGHSSTLVEIDGVRVLIDPVWDQRASPVQWAGPKRFFDAPLKLEDMPAVDVVIVSHDHYDHLGKATIQRLSRLPAMVGARWVTSVGVGEILCGFGVARERVAELHWTESVTITGAGGEALEVTALPARHFSGRGMTRFETLWSSFVLRGREHRIYFGADSGWWEGYTEIGAAYGPFDLTMLEIGAFHELWQDIHLGPDGAVRAYEAMGGTGLLMPIHWGLFDLALHGWRQPMERLTELAAERGLRVWAPEPGCPTDVERGAAFQSDWWR